MQVNTNLNKAIKKALIDKSLCVKDLATFAGRNYYNIARQLNGYQRMTESTKQLVKEYLGIDADQYTA